MKLSIEIILLFSLGLFLGCDAPSKAEPAPEPAPVQKSPIAAPEALEVPQANTSWQEGLSECPCTGEFNGEQCWCDDMGEVEWSWNGMGFLTQIVERTGERTCRLQSWQWEGDVTVAPELSYRGSRVI